MTVELSSEVRDALLLEADQAHPRECCGILLGGTEAIDGLVSARNVHSLPETHFEIDPQALVDSHRTARSGGPQVVGYYHSHPNGLAEPSATDRASAARDGSIWAIVARGKVSLWRDGDDGFAPLPYRIRER